MPPLQLESPRTSGVICSALAKGRSEGKWGIWQGDVYQHLDFCGGQAQHWCWMLAWLTLSLPLEHCRKTQYKSCPFRRLWEDWNVQIPEEGRSCSGWIHMTQLKLAALLPSSCRSCPVSSEAPFGWIYSSEEDIRWSTVTRQIFFFLPWAPEGLLQHLHLPHTNSNHV